MTEGKVPSKIHLIAGAGGIISFGLDKIIDIWILLQPKEELKKQNIIKDKCIRRWVHNEGFSSFKKYVTTAKDKELEAKIELDEEYNYQDSRTYGIHRRMPHQRLELHRVHFGHCAQNQRLRICYHARFR